MYTPFLDSATSLLFITFLTISLFYSDNLCNGKAVEESSTGAIISFPEVSDGELFNVTWEVEPAAFGYADYGGTLEAYLVLPMNKTFHTECETEKDGLNTYLHYIKDQSASDTDIIWILVIDRGDCYFASKVYNAQEMGASGVIVLDNEQEAFFPMWEPDNFDNNIIIPSVEMKMSNASVLMSNLGVVNWDPNADMTDNTTNIYPAAEDGFQITKVIIEWGLPHEDDRVEWEMWTSSNDDETIEFKKNFQFTSIFLDENNYTIFTPHYYILNGSHWGCDIKKHGQYRCGNQCTNSGRYCAVDPEYDLDIGVSGEDVVRENLRQLCVWNFTTHGDASIHNESVWWDYSNLWNEKCFNGTEKEETFHTNCSVDQILYLESLGVTGLLNYVEECINQTGGYGTNDGENELLDYEVLYREDLSVYTLPSFRVNEFMIWGEVDCEIVTEDGCSVLDSICSGFIEGTAPHLCDYTPAPTASTTGCDGITNSNKEYNPCGYCIASNLSNFNTFGQGCDGVCDSGYETDDCGVCRSTKSESWNGCFGCDGIAHSGKEYNPCGFCILNTTKNFNDYGKDCNGTCEGTKETDECGNCLETSDEEWNSCVETDTYGTGGTAKTTDTNGLSAAVWVIGVIAFIVIVIAGIIIYKLYKKQQEQSKQFNNILKTYTLMDENPNNNEQIGQSPGQTKNPFSKNKGMPVPTDDFDSPRAANNTMTDDNDNPAVV